MDVFGTVATVIEGVVVIYKAVEEVKSFKSSSKKLADRVKIVIEPVKELEKKVDDGKSYKYKLPAEEDRVNIIRTPLRRLADCIKEVGLFLKDLSTKSTLEKFGSKGKITAQFEEFNIQLTDLQQSLSLGLQVVFNKEMNDKFDSMKFNQDIMNKESQECLAADLRDLEDLVKEIKATVKENNELLKQQQQREPKEVCLPVFSYRGFAVGDEDKIEEGTFGPIYKAKHNMEDKLLVIKKYSDKSDPSVDELKLQLAVWRKLATSSYIVQPYGYTMDDDGHMCFVLEYMDFGTLRNVLRSKEHELAWDRRLSLARDCARGLYAIHNGTEGRTMLHRAVTSTRFLVNKHYVAKISDNGFVKSQSKVSKSTTFKGQGSLEKDEINYYVPEDTDTQFKATVRSEIYKLGVVLYEIASRMEPFQSMQEEWKGLSAGEVNEAKRMFILEGRMEEPPADTPDAFKDLMNRCRATKPSDRPSTADVVSSLDKIIFEKI